MLEQIKQRKQQRKLRKIKRGMLEFIEIYLRGYVSHYPGLTMERVDKGIDPWCVVIYGQHQGQQKAVYRAHYEDGAFFFVYGKQDEWLPKWRKKLLDFDIKTLARLYIEDHIENAIS